MLHGFDPLSSGKAFAFPRSWASLSGIFDANPNPDAEYELFRGTVGDGAAAEFMGPLRVWRGLPSVEDIPANSTDTLVSDDLAALYVVCEALSEKAVDGTVNVPVAYAGHLPPELGVLSMYDAVCHDERIVHISAFASRAQANAHVLM